MRTNLLVLAMAAVVAVVPGVSPASPPLSGADAQASGDGAAAPIRPGGDRGSPEVYNGAEGELRVNTPVKEEAGISVDGRLDETAWERAALLTGFTQFEPREGDPAALETGVRVFVDSEAIYFGVRAHDSTPGGIRATMGERDEIADSDDYIRVTLDTFHDQRRGYVFLVNPLGVQQDGIWVEGGGGGRRRFGPPIDWNPDFIWESGGRIGGEGYVVELRVPFKSLRFPDADAQTWGLQVERAIKRLGYEQSWAPITEDVANRLSQQGELANLRGLDPGLFLEVNPVLTGRRTGGTEELDSGEEVFRRDDPTVDFGFNATYGVTSNLTLDATFNPDFSQVEADAGQIAVNERFALFFPEKRPFFLEGTEIFSLPLQLVFTRSIADPVGGAKLTGKVGSLNVGYLGAADEGGRKLGGAGTAAVNLLRVRRDLGESSTLGFTYTDRTVGSGAYNRVAGVDARLVFGGRYTLSLQGAGSVTAYGAEDGDTDPRDAFAGSLLRAELERSGRNLSFSASLEDLAPEFEARSGFIRRTGDAELRSRVGYSWYGGADDVVETLAPSFELERVWDHGALWRGAAPKEGRIEAGGRVSLRNNLTVNVDLTRRFFSYGPGAYEGLYRTAGAGGGREAFAPDPGLFDGLHGVQLFIWTNTFRLVRGRIRASWEETAIFDRSTGAPVEPADAFSVDGRFSFYPTRRLRAEVGIRHEELHRQRDASRYSRATIPRLEAQYQFSRALFLRLIGEYSRQDQEGLRDPVTGGLLEYCDDDGECERREGEEENDFHLEALLSFEPSPGTIMFVGYSREMEERRAFAFDDLEPRADGLFAKVSYRFRF